MSCELQVKLTKLADYGKSEFTCERKILLGWNKIFFFLSQFLGNFFLFNFLTLAIFTLVSFKSNGKIQLWEGKIILLNYFHTLCWAIKHLENEFCENEFDEIERKILLIILVIFFCFKLWQSETSNFFFIPSEKSCQQFCCNFA